ncbi:MAG: GNAT family N-acetyltransferase [Planctomycetes bacterium]|nr:GNAT family N-acetyltransferase [Planctomycetota bacterium]
MSLKWIAEHPATWDADKARVIGGAEAGIFDARFSSCRDGELLPGEWWHVEDDGRRVGFGWLDVVWGDAEIQIAVDPESRDQGVGRFIVENLEKEAAAKGLRYLYNTVRPGHPRREEVSRWLESLRFRAKEDGALYRTVARA